jgi:hypothetical protein
MPNVFISHRKLDNLAAERLARDLEQRGHKVWFDEWRIDVGDSIVARVNEGLQGSSYLVLGCSSSGLSDWMDREWMSTLARQLSGHGMKVLPVLLTGGRPPAILADIKFADLVADWDQGVQELSRAIR